MSSLDEDLDREVEHILTRGEEWRRSEGVKELTVTSTPSIALRVVGVAAAIAALTALLHVAGFTFMLRAPHALCVSLGLCG